MLHVWNIYLHDWVILVVNVGTYSIHGAYGLVNVAVKWQPVFLFPSKGHVHSSGIVIMQMLDCTIAKMIFINLPSSKLT